MFLSLSKRAILESDCGEMHLVYATTRFAACGVGLRYPYRFASCFFFFLEENVFSFLRGQPLNLFLICLAWSVESDMDFH